MVVNSTTNVECCLITKHYIFQKCSFPSILSSIKTNSKNKAQILVIRFQLMQKLNLIRCLLKPFTYHFVDSRFGFPNFRLCRAKDFFGLHEHEVRILSMFCSDMGGLPDDFSFKALPVSLKAFSH